MNSRIKFRLAAAASLFCAPLAAMATVTVSTDTTWSSGSYSEAVIINSGAKLTVNGDVSVNANVDVGGADGGGALEISSATLANSSSRIRFNVNLPSGYTGPRSSADYVSEMILKPNGVAKCAVGLSQNGAFDSRVRFEGGQLMFNTYTKRSLFSAAGSVLHLEGMNGNDIDLFFSYTGNQPLYLLQDWSVGNTSPRLAFQGDCDVVLNANQYAALHMQTYGSNVGDKLSTGGGTIVWNQTGDLVLKNYILMTLDGDMMLPYGAQTGGVVLNGSSAVLDFNGRRAAVNAITATQGLVTNSAATAATIILGLNNTNANISDIVKADLRGVFNYEKAGTGTLTIDKGNYGTLTVADGAVAFAATPGTAITVDSLVVNSATMGTLVVDGVALTVDTAGGSALGGVMVVTRNGGTFSCGTWGSSSGGTLRNPDLAATDALVKPGAGLLTIASANSLPAKLDVRAGTVRFRTPYLTGGSKMMIKYTFKKTSGTNRKLALEEIRMRGYNNVGIWTDNAIAAHNPPTDRDRYTVRSSIAEVFENYGVWVNGEYVESTDSGNLLPYSPSYLFDNGASTSRIYTPTNTIPVPSDPASWQQVVFRVFWWDPTIKVMGYNFTKGFHQNWNNGLPMTWTVEATTNGTDWAVIDERTDKMPPECEEWRQKQWYVDGTDFEYNGSRDFALIGLGPERGVGSAASVRVDAGATIDFEGLADSERTISALEINMAVGGGHITTFAPAANGVLDVVNLSGKLTENTDLGLTFDSVVGATNLNTWTVRVNGVEKPRRLAARNGKLLVLAESTVLYVR